MKAETAVQPPLLPFSSSPLLQPPPPPQPTVEKPAGTQLWLAHLQPQLDWPLELRPPTRPPAPPAAPVPQQPRVPLLPDPPQGPRPESLTPPVKSKARNWLQGPADMPPAEFTPWWQNAALRPLRPMSEPIPVDVNRLIVDALRYSPRIRSIAETPLIARTSIVEAKAEFDVHAFTESKLVRTSVPTGTTLEAGFNVPRLRQEDWYYRAGLRKKIAAGGRFEVAQRYGLRDSNSVFFTPPNQGNSQLTLSYNQPLLSGAGRAYNNSLIVLADIDTRIAQDGTLARLQDHLLAVTESLWELYLRRAALLQKQRHLQRAVVIEEHLKSRREVDSLDSQIARAQAAVATRRAMLIRAATDVRNAESRVRSLVDSPQLLASRDTELVTRQAPTQQLVPIDLQDALVTALQSRPEIDAAINEIEAARVRLNVAKNELLPVLDMVLETYVMGLQGDFDVARAWQDQFSRGEPSYTAGLVMEAPLGRRAAKARYQRRQLELRQLSSQLQNAVELLRTDVEVAVREVETTHSELQATYQAMLAAQKDIQYLQSRWELVPGDDRAASFLLEDLLESQNRLVAEEFAFAKSQVDYTLSHTRLNRVMGTLLRHENVTTLQGLEAHVPTLVFEKLEPQLEEVAP